MKVLIADDSVVVQQRLVKLISSIEGVEIVGQASTGAETISLVRSQKPDIVILDIQMPDGTGIDVLAKFKNDKNKPKFIVLSNYSTEAFREKCLVEGANRFFDKSTEFEKVINVLKHISKNS